MTLNEYQTETRKFCLQLHNHNERIFGLLEEAGEVAGAMKRLHRGDFAGESAFKQMKAELGDVMWYIANICSDQGWNLEDVCQDNIKKLTDREARGVVKGNGDDR